MPRTIAQDTTTLMMVSKERNGGNNAPFSDTDVLGKVTDMFTGGEKPPPCLQVGGNETVGMGWCRVAEVKG